MPINTPLVHFGAQIGAGDALVSTSVTIDYLSLTGGAISGPGTLTLEGPLASTWSGGTLSGPGTLLVSSGATLNISGSAAKTFNRNDGLSSSGGRTIDNYGTINVLGTGSLLGGDGAQIINRGVFDFQQDTTVGYSGTGSTPTFTNSGTLRKTAGSGGVVFSQIAFLNTGQVDVQTGSLTFDAAVTSTGGSFKSSADALIVFTAGQSFNSTSFEGDGLKLLSSGVTTLSGSISANNLRFAGGTLQGTASVSGAMDWIGGQWSGTGTLTISSGASLNIFGADSKTFNRNDGLSSSGGRVIENYGTISWFDTGQLLGGEGAQIINRSGGDFMVGGSSVLGYSGTGALPTFTNEGVFRKLEVAGTTTISGMTFTNTGEVRADIGTLEFLGSVVSHNGLFHTDSGTNIIFAGTQSFQESSLVGNGSIRIVAGDTTFAGNITAQNVEFAGGSLLGSALVSGTLAWTGGTWRSPNTLTFASGSTLTLSGAADKTISRGDGLSSSGGRVVRTAGTIDWQDTGRIIGHEGAGIEVFSGGLFKFSNSSTYQYGGTGDLPSLINAGTVRKVGSAGTTTLDSVLFANNGLLQIQSGTLALIGGGGLANNGTVQVQAGSLISSATGATSTGGTFDVYSGSQLRFTGGTNTMVSSVFTGGGLTEVAGGTLVVSGSTITGLFQLSTGTIGGAGTLTVASGGDFTWSGGNLIGTGTLAIDSGGELIIDGTAAKNFYRGDGLSSSGGRTIANAGIVTWSGTGSLLGGEGASFVNLGTGTVEITGNATFGYTGIGSTPTFANDGLVRKSAGSGVTDFSQAFTNNGIARSQVGTLRFSGGGSGNGQFTAIGGTIEFAASYTWNDGARIFGSGTTRIAAGTITVPGSATATVGNATTDGVLALDGGAIDGSGTLVVGGLGRMDWSGGTLRGTGTLRIASGGQLNLLGSVDHEFLRGDGLSSSGGRTIENFGTILWSAGNLRGGEGGQILNRAGGVFNIQTGGILGYTGLGSMPTFSNEGTFRKSAGPTTTVSSLAFSSTGLVDVLSGGLAFTSGVSSTGGTFNAVSGTTLTFSGGQGFTGATFTGSGTIQATGGTTTFGGTITASRFVLAGGSLLGTATISGLLEWTGGLIRGPNTLTIGAGSTLLVSGSGDRTFDRGDGLSSNGGRVIENQGILRVENTGNLLGSEGAQIINRPTGHVDLRNNATLGYGGTGSQPAITNEGIFTKTVGAGTSTIAVPFANTGTIAVTSGTLAFTSTFTNTSGHLSLLNGATVSFASAFESGTGVISGSGTIIAPQVNAGGVTTPGLPNGTLAITGNLNLLSTSMLLLEIGGTSQGTNYDFVAVSGSATAGGMLVLTLTNSFLPNAGATFTVLTGGNLAGAFANVANGQRHFTTDGVTSFQVNYGTGSAFSANSIVLSHFSAVPEPSTWALMLIGGALATLQIRRRKRRKN